MEDGDRIRQVVMEEPRSGPQVPDEGPTTGSQDPGHLTGADRRV
jgi:hypothetical protein